MHNTNLSDNELLDLLKEHQQQALSALYYRYWDKLLVVAGNHIENYAIAEESVQDVFFSLWKRRNELDLKYSLFHLSFCSHQIPGDRSARQTVPVFSCIIVLIGNVKTKVEKLEGAWFNKRLTGFKSQPMFRKKVLLIYKHTGPELRMSN